MKYTITAVEFEHDDVLTLIDKFIEDIEDKYIREADMLEHQGGFEFEQWTDDEQIQVMLNVEFFTEYEILRKPDNPKILERSVKTKLTMFNSDGQEITFKIKGERYHNTTFNRFQTRTPIDIEDEIQKYCTI